jgi:hypothetical protein
MVPAASGARPRRCALAAPLRQGAVDPAGGGGLRGCPRASSLKARAALLPRLGSNG